MGYEAELADMNWDIYSEQDMAINLEFKGYSDKIFEFAEAFFEILFSSAKKDGFEQSSIMDSMESVKQ